MELAQWGAGLGDDLPWLDPPPAAAMQGGTRETCNSSACWSTTARSASVGRLIGGLGVHPRLGMLLLEAQRTGRPPAGV